MILGYLVVGFVVLLLASWLVAFCLDPEAFRSGSRR